MKASPRQQLLVYLGGPLVTALLIPMLVWAAIECASMPGWISATWILSTFGATWSLLYSLDPRSANKKERESSSHLLRDGPLAIAAYRAWRARGGS